MDEIQQLKNAVKSLQEHVLKLHRGALFDSVRITALQDCLSAVCQRTGVFKTEEEARNALKEINRKHYDSVISSFEKDDQFFASKMDVRELMTQPEQDLWYLARIPFDI